MFAKAFCDKASTALRWNSSLIVMPLRAKVTNPAFTSRAQMSTTPSQSQQRNQKEESIRELPGDSEDDVVFKARYGVRTIELNRPEKLHSLDGSMIRKIVPRLHEWAKSDMANVVIIKGSGPKAPGPKAFCAGGDVAALAKDNLEQPEGLQRAIDYFSLEYKLDHLIATYETPYIAYMDGITMGGGVGLSIHAPFRIATERTVFAMPETTIGFFPDVGASFFLPRMPGSVGTYLALISERLKGANAFYAGVATHFIHSTVLPLLENRLAELQFRDYESLDERLGVVDATIEEYCTGLPHDQPNLLSSELRKAIDRCFCKDNVPDIVTALKAEEGETKEWAEKTLKTLHQRSPTSVCVTLRQLRLARNWSIRETFYREHQMAAKFMRHPDFKEGVDALLIRKDGKPQWQPKSLEDVGSGASIADPFFEVDEDQRIILLSNEDYKEYPHRKYGIPLEAEVGAFVREVRRTPQEVIDHFVEERKGKQGVKEVVMEMLKRKTKMDDGKAVWVSDENES